MFISKNIVRSFSKNTTHQYTFIFSFILAFVLLSGCGGGTSAENNVPDIEVNDESTGNVSANRVLMFVAYNGTWWAEFKVAYESLVAAGYTVDVRSSASGLALTYGDNISTTSSSGIENPASYTAFTEQFENNVGVAWNADWNNLQNIVLDGAIQDVVDMASYDALVIPGGYGSQSYRYDGSYFDLLPSAELLALGHQPADADNHIALAVDVESAAIKLNNLIVDSLASGKPVMTVCHAAPLAAFSRIPGTEGEGFDALGLSVLDGKYATGFPLDFEVGGAAGDVADAYNNLNVGFLRNEAVVIDGPDGDLDADGSIDFSGNARDRLVTVADWYPESSAYGVRTLLNIIETYPTEINRTKNISVLVFGGNEPTHYAYTPANEVDVAALLNASSEYAISAAITDNEQLVIDTLSSFDVLVYFQHNAVSQTLQDAIVAYVDNGGGAVFIHHGIYNHLAANNTLINMVGGELPADATLADTDIYFSEGVQNNMVNVNYGHFVSSYEVFLNENILTPDLPQTVTYTPSDEIFSNQNLDTNGGYFMFQVGEPDELYPASRFVNTDFGTGVNQINRIFANNTIIGNGLTNDGQYDTWGWTRIYDADANGVAGRIVYLQPGETNEITFANPQYQQVVRNAVVWTAIP